jgi:hypothetical protein
VFRLTFYRLFHTLNTGASLASWQDSSSNLSSVYSARATVLNTAIQAYCFDSAYGAFRDNATNTALHPQDANSLSLLFGLISPNSSTAYNISTNLLKNWTPIGAETPELPNNISPFISSFEIGGHFTIGQTDRALELIRRSWGWYINHPNGSESTVIEGYLTNGSFGYRNSRGYSYDTSYVSHSHGWSSGPTSALTEYVLGLSVTGRAGSTWSLKPQFGNLTSVEGGFTTSLGKFSAKWQTTGNGYQLSYVVPVGTLGELELPVPKGGVKKLLVDRKQVRARLIEGAAAGSKISLNGEAGSHTIVVSS